jgi:endonuclease/exonuclease/phosphatase family metal-dependent hydrolase
MESLKCTVSRSIRQAVWAFFLCVVLLPSLGAPARADEVPALRVRAMTFNIRYGTANDGPDRWENRRHLVFDRVRQSDADVIGLQEALHFQIRQILDTVEGYASIGVGRDDGAYRGEFSNILYRTDRFRPDACGTFWLSDTPTVPGSKSWGNTITRICTWVRLVEKDTGRAFYMFNVHLDHQSQPSREKSAALIARRIADRAHPNEPIILTGDFNAGEQNPAILYLKGKGPAPDGETTPMTLVDSYRVLHPEAETVGTFNGFKGRTDGDKIDYVFVQPETHVLDTNIDRTNEDGRYPSDHFPVTATVLLRVGEQAASHPGTVVVPGKDAQAK